MVLKNHNIVIHINIQEANLPIIYNYYFNSVQNKCHGPLLRSVMEFIGLDYLDLFGDLITEGEVMLTDRFEHFSQFCGPCVGSSKNQKVTDTQKGLLLWNWNLGISMYSIKYLMKE